MRSAERHDMHLARAQFPPGPALTIPYVMGQRTYNVSLILPTLPCDASPSCVDYIGGICDQQGVG
jgi:hypothetical protein